MSHPERGAAVLNILLSFAAFATITYGVFEMIPANPGPQTASAVLASVDTPESTPLSTAAAEPDLKISLAASEENARCKAAVKSDASAAGSTASGDTNQNVLNECVKGCTYRISKVSGVPVKAQDDCLPAIKKSYAECLAEGKGNITCGVGSNIAAARCYAERPSCVVLYQCDEYGENCSSLDKSGKEEYVSVMSKAGFGTMGDDTRVKDAIKKMGENPTFGQAQLSQLPDYLQDVFKAKTAETVEANQAKIESAVKRLEEYADVTPDRCGGNCNKRGFEKEELERDIANLRRATANLEGIASGDQGGLIPPAPRNSNNVSDGAIYESNGQPYPTQSTFSMEGSTLLPEGEEPVVPKQTTFFAGECEDCGSLRYLARAVWSPIGETDDDLPSPPGGKLASSGYGFGADFENLRPYPSMVWDAKSQEDAAFEELNRGEFPTPSPEVSTRDNQIPGEVDCVSNYPHNCFAKFTDGEERAGLERNGYHCSDDGTCFKGLPASEQGGPDTYDAISQNGLTLNCYVDDVCITKDPVRMVDVSKFQDAGYICGQNAALDTYCQINRDAVAGELKNPAYMYPGLGYIPQEAAEGASRAERMYVSALNGGWAYDIVSGGNDVNGLSPRGYRPDDYVAPSYSSDTTDPAELGAGDCATRGNCLGKTPLAVWYPPELSNTYPNPDEATGEPRNSPSGSGRLTPEEHERYKDFMMNNRPISSEQLKEFQDLQYRANNFGGSCMYGFSTEGTCLTGPINKDTATQLEAEGWKCYPSITNDGSFMNCYERAPAGTAPASPTAPPLAQPDAKTSGVKTPCSPNNQECAAGTDTSAGTPKKAPVAGADPKSGLSNVYPDPKEAVGEPRNVGAPTPAPTPRQDGKKPEEEIKKQDNVCYAIASSGSERLYLVNRGYYCESTGVSSFTCTLTTSGSCTPAFNPTPVQPAPQTPKPTAQTPAPAAKPTPAPQTQQGGGTAQQGSGAQQTPAAPPVSGETPSPQQTPDPKLTQKPLWDTQTGLPCTDPFANKIVCGTVQAVPLPWQKPQAAPSVTAQNLQNYPGWQPGTAAPISQTGGMCYASIYNQDQFTYAIARGYTCQYGMYPTVCSKPDLGAPSSCTSP